MNAGVADRADRSPVEAAEVDDQVWSHVSDALIEFLRLKDQRAERISLVVRESFEPGFDFVLERFVLVLGNYSVRLPTLHIEKDPGVIATFAPDAGLRPVHLQLVKRGKGFRILMQDQQAFLNQPLVNGDATVEALRPVIGNDEDEGVIVEQFQGLADLAIEPEIVFGNRVLVGISRLELHMLFVEVIPEAVMHAVEADVNKMKVIPLLVLQQPMDESPLLLAHFEDFIFQPVLAIGAEIFHVHGIVAHQIVDFRLERCGMGEVVLGRIGREKTSDADAVNAAWWIVRRHAHEDRALPFPRQLVPDGKSLDGSGIREAELVIGMINPVAESIHTERAGVLASRHTHPGGNRNGRNHAFEAAVDAGVHQAAEVYQPLVTKDDFGRSAVESKHTDFHFKIEQYLPSVWEQARLNDSGLWAPGQ